MQTSGYLKTHLKLSENNCLTEINYLVAFGCSFHYLVAIIWLSWYRQNPLWWQGGHQIILILLVSRLTYFHLISTVKN